MEADARVLKVPSLTEEREVGTFPVHQVHTALVWKLFLEHIHLAAPPLTPPFFSGGSWHVEGNLKVISLC